MAQPYDFLTISICLRNLAPHVDDLLDKDADDLYAKVLKDLTDQEIEDGEKRQRVGELLRQLQDHQKFMERFDRELSVVSARRDHLQNQTKVILGEDKTDIVDELCSIVLEHTEHLDSESERYIVLEEGGKSGATSIKFANIVSTIERISNVVIGMVSNIPLIQSNNPVYLGCGIFIYLNVLKESATYEISERDASVYWGLIIGSRSSDTMTEEKALEHTNTERNKREMDELKLLEVRQALNSLEKIGAIELLDGAWRIIEQFRIKY